MANSEYMQHINSNTPRDTIVFAVNDYTVKKQPNSNPQKRNWLKKQAGAKNIIDELKLLNNKPVYFVPAIKHMDSTEYYILEDRAQGKPLTEEFIKTLSKEDLEIIYTSFANFLNDINQLKPILTQYEFHKIRNQNLTITDLLQQLKSLHFNLDFDYIKQLNELYKKLSSNDTSVVFAHKDINEHNLFYDPKTKTLSILDLAEAGYQDINYQFYTDCSKLTWLDIQKLINIYIKLQKNTNVIINKNDKLFVLRITLYNIYAFCKSLLTTTLNSTLSTAIINSINIEIQKAKQNIVALQSLNTYVQKDLEH